MEFAHVAVDAEFQVLSKGESLDAADIAQIKEPDVGKDFPLVHISCDDAAQNFRLDLDVGGRIDPGEL